MIKLNLADNRTFFKTLPDNSIDSIVTDPPYGIRFMSSKWDHSVPSKEVWLECLRVLKPGGHMLVACGTRTQHRMVAPIEDAGFEIRDVITYLYGSGFPKSLDISKAIDKEAGAEREILGRKKGSGNRPHVSDQSQGKAYRLGKGDIPDTVPSSEAAKQWQGFGTALKPAVEFWTLCRKPLSESTVAKNVLKHGTGGINVDGCRVPGAFESGWSKSGSKESENTSMSGKNYARDPLPDNPQGRFPANLILDEEAGAALDEQSGFSISRPHKNKTAGPSGWKNVSADEAFSPHNDSGGASRFFYCAKASKSDRGEGNTHPTVKPTKLMEYLCRLITPPGGTVLDPFMGSGSTGVGAVREGFKFIGVELCEEYFQISKARLNVSQ